MQRPSLKFYLIGLGVVASMAVLVVVGTQGSGVGYYMTVSEFLVSEDQTRLGLRVNGKVVHGTIARQDSGEDVGFEMTDGGAVLAVQYHGIIPDTFVDDAEVVVEGSLQTDSVFNAHTMLAKCPSKYEAAEGYEETAEASAPQGGATTAAN